MSSQSPSPLAVAAPISETADHDRLANSSDAKCIQSSDKSPTPLATPEELNQRQSSTSGVVSVSAPPFASLSANHIEVNSTQPPPKPPAEEEPQVGETWQIKNRFDNVIVLDPHW